MRTYFSILLLFLTPLFGKEELSQKAKICLNMIVKNEHAVIERCLESTLPLIDYWVIVDTGSTDGTQELIKNFMKKHHVPGILYERPWVNFEHNRNEALEFARDKADYLLMIDADEYFILDPDFKTPPLLKDFYYITIQYGGMNYQRVELINTSLDWKWVGVIHEVLVPPSPLASSGNLSGITRFVTTEGARSSDPQKFQKDAALLEEALKKEPQNNRYQFYLAQSYRDAGDLLSALTHYQKRIDMRGWDQEVFWSYYQKALLKLSLNHPTDEVISALFKAYQFRPTRIEPLCQLATLYRKEQNYKKAYDIATLAQNTPPSNDVLFVEHWMIDYAIPLEISIAAYWLENYEECQLISLDLLKKDIPQNYRDCISNNLQFANSKLVENIILQD